MAEVTLKRSAAELHVRASDGSPSIQDLVERIISIAGTTPSDMVDLLGTESGSTLARLDVVEAEGNDPDRFLRSWDSIGHTSPAALSESQYQRFLRGDHPADATAKPFELYGAGLKADT